MDESKRHFRLGAFVVVTLTTLFAVLLLLGGRKLFEPSFTFETYFDTSVSGLDIGAPVRFRGVPLGQVSEILTSAATYERNVPLGQRREYIIVRAKINFSAAEAQQIEHDALQMVSRGLRTQTQLAGLTGQQYLAIDLLDPDKYPPLPFDWTAKYPYLPSAPSPAGEIVAHVQAFLARLNEADLVSLGQNVNRLVADLDLKLNEVPAGELASAARSVLGNASATLGRLDRVLADERIDRTLHALDSATARIDTLLREGGGVDALVRDLDQAAQRADVLLADNHYDVRAIVQDLRATADNLHALSETVKRYPAGALLGGPPEKVQLPGDTP